MEPTAYTTPTPWYKRKIIWIFLLILILIPIGFYVFKMYFLKAPQIKSGTNVNDLPVALEILQNPMVYEWRGSVKGTLTAKDEHTLTIEDEKGNEITVTELLPDGSGTFKTVYLKKTRPRVTELALQDVPLGTVLRGEFFVFKNFPSTPVGSMFIIEE